MKNKTKYKEDDGHTIYNMNIDGMPGYKKPSANDSYVIKKEKRAMIKACYRVYFIPLLILIIGFILALVLLYFLWLN